MKTVGLTVGKFMPPHIGHKLMIDFGSIMYDEMVVIVGGEETDEIPVSKRVEWLEEHYAGTNVRIEKFFDTIDIGTDEVDEHGTVTNDTFWKLWTAVFRHYAPNATHFVSSDWYGKRAAHDLGIEWVPVDLDRETFPISATAIREDPMQHWEYILPEAKGLYMKSVAVVGPESCGKSTLTKLLAEKFRTVGVPEFGRTLSFAKNNKLTEDDFDTIVNGQMALTIASAIHMNRIIFSDTEAYTTYLFGKIYLNKNLTHIKDFAISQQFDLYLLLAPTVNWVDDGLRVVPEDDARWKFFNDLKDFLEENNKPFIIIDAGDFGERRLEAVLAVNDLLEKTNEF